MTWLARVFIKCWGGQVAHWRRHWLLVFFFHSAAEKFMLAWVLFVYRLDISGVRSVFCLLRCFARLSCLWSVSLFALGRLLKLDWTWISWDRPLHDQVRGRHNANELTIGAQGRHQRGPVTRAGPGRGHRRSARHLHRGRGSGHPPARDGVYGRWLWRLVFCIRMRSKFLVDWFFLLLLHRFSDELPALGRLRKRGKSPNIVVYLVNLIIIILPPGPSSLSGVWARFVSDVAVNCASRSIILR